jgi:hypothetical protein
MRVPETPPPLGIRAGFSFWRVTRDWRKKVSRDVDDGYFSESVTSEILKNSHLFASVIHASRRRA